MLGIISSLFPGGLLLVKDSLFFRSLITLQIYVDVMGIIFGVYALYRATMLIKHILDLNYGKVVDLKKFGKWAIVTGCTDGIGKAYTHELARMGLDIVLISRNKEKLEQLSRELKAEHGVQTKILQVDFTNREPSLYQDIAAQLKGLEIGTLVNNVGMCFDYPEYYTKLPTDRIITDMIYCNIISMTQMTRIILPQMEERRNGFILNVGSVSGVVNCPLLISYSGTKAYVDRWSQGLAQELEDKGVLIQTILPSYVSTKLSGMKPRRNTVPSPQEYVTSQMRTIGKWPRTSGFWSHEIKMQFAEFGQACTPIIVKTVAKKILFGQRFRALRRRGLYNGTQQKKES